MKERFYKWTTSKKIVASFLFLILVGSILLSMPISQLEDVKTTYMDHLFHSVSMVCVTGLSRVPISSIYSTFGLSVSLLLIQCGGLGLMTLVASAASTLGRKMRLRERLAVQEGINQSDAKDLKTYLSNIVKYTFFIEAMGFLSLCIYFIPALGFKKGSFTSLFLTISAFNNAGFDNLGATSLNNYVHEPLVNIVISFLIILGGIGFIVWFDVARVLSNNYSRKQSPFNLIQLFRKLTLHSKIAIFTTFSLTFISAFLFFVVEYNNVYSIGTFSFFEKILASFFQSITMRTAGFSTIDYGAVHPFTLINFIFSMFIGGSPGGAAGGLKTTTFVMVILLIYNELRGQKNVNVLRHTIPESLVRNALVISVIFLFSFLLGSTLLLLLNPEVPYIHLMFETVSALATVGVTVNLTPSLGVASHIIIMIMMFAGRVGPITLVDSLLRKDEFTKNITYAKGKIIIG